MNTHLCMPIKLISTLLPRPLRNIVNKLLSRPTSPAPGINEKIVQIEVRSETRSGRVRVVCCESYGLAVGFIGGDGAVDGVGSVEEAVESGVGHVGGDGAFVEDVVLLPEVLPGFFVGGLDWADLDGGFWG